MRLSLTIPPYDWWCLAAPAARNDEQEESGEQEQSPHPDPPPEGWREIGLRPASDGEVRGRRRRRRGGHGRRGDRRDGLIAGATLARIAGKAGGRRSGAHRLIGTRDGAGRRAGRLGRRGATLRRRPRAEPECQGAARERRAAVL